MPPGTADQTLDTVIRVVAETTRYPQDLLTPAADIEDELGIDSVKRAEIANRLATTFRLTRTDLAGVQKARTLAQLAGAVAAVARASAGQEPVPANGKPAGTGPAPAEDPLATVTAVAARVTRLPPELLAADADLEDELGIDSLKLSEIIAGLRTAFPDLANAQPNGRLARTLREMAARVMALRGGNPAAPAAVKPTPTAAPAPRPDRPLAGRVAFVSGSGRGLGRATALELAGRGAAVVVNSFHHREAGEQTVGEIRDSGGTAEHLWGSMARPDQIDRIFDQLRDRFDCLDFFVHSASDGAFTRLADAAEEQWLKSFRTNVIGLHHAALRAAALMRPRGGRILTLSSVFTDAVVDYFGVQGTVKAAVEALTRFLAKELLPQGVAVNCVSFASLDGEVMRHYPDAERVNGRVERASLHGRRSDDAEAARALAMLLGDDAAPLTGAVLRFDRGFCLGAVGGD
jgi:NAD(P)-dependent dehydrogenase (short-subunit alcohol dehydrogenase family)/acyl carrier protein